MSVTGMSPDLQAIIRSALLAAEWEGSETDHRCPVCRESRMAGHLKTCALAKALAALGT